MEKEPRGPTPEMEKAFEQRMAKAADRPPAPRPQPQVLDPWRIGFRP